MHRFALNNICAREKAMSKFRLKYDLKKKSLDIITKTALLYNVYILHCVSLLLSTKYFKKPMMYVLRQKES